MSRREGLARRMETMKSWEGEEEAVSTGGPLKQLMGTYVVWDLDVVDVGGCGGLSQAPDGL